MNIHRLYQSVKSLVKAEEKFDEIKMNQGRILAKINSNTNSTNIQDYEFKVFSQWGEDGIIQHLVNTINIKYKTFIEFGTEDFSESNCRFLMMKDNWSGFVIDGSEKNIKKIQRSYYFWKYDLQAIHAFIDRENINQLLSKSGFHQDLGILSIDIDGNDYYILEAITLYKPRILICEYNAVFGLAPIAVPYDPKFQRTKKHFSNLYFGASLSAITNLAESKGYSLVGTNSTCGNAFYVRNDVMNERLQQFGAQEIFEPSKERQSRDKNGKLDLLRGDEREKALVGLPVFNTITCQITKFDGPIE